MENCRERIRDELEQEYQKHKETTGEFINTFAKKCKLDLPADTLFDPSVFFEMFDM